MHSGKSLTRSLTSTTARILRARPWLAPVLGFLVFLAGGAAWLSVKPVDEGPAPPRAPSGAPLLVENLVKDVHLDAVTLSWTTSVPVRSGVRVKAAGEPERRHPASEAPGTVHQVRVGGLSRDRDYQVVILSTTAAGEPTESAPIVVKMFGSVWAEALAAIRAGNLEAMRAPLAPLRKLSRAFFDSSDISPRAKLDVYGPLKSIEHAERLAAVEKRPMLPVLGAFDWGCYAQRETSFDDPALPLPLPRKNTLISNHSTPKYFTEPASMRGVRVDQQLVADDGPRFLTEWRADQRENDALAVLARGDKDGVRELSFRFAVPDARRFSAAELWLAFGACSPLQFFELSVNGAPPLIVRPPLETPVGEWSRLATGLDPALLVPGENVVTVRLKPLPEMIEGRRVPVWYLELRTRARGA